MVEILVPLAWVTIAFVILKKPFFHFCHRNGKELSYLADIKVSWNKLLPVWTWDHLKSLAFGWTFSIRPNAVHIISSS